MVEAAKSVTLKMQKLPLNYRFRTEYHYHCVFFEESFPSSETKTWKTTGRICKYSS